MDERTKLLKHASFIALGGNAFLAAAKLIIGILTGSLAVIGDGIDSSTDVIIAIVALVIVRIIDKPGDAEHPYGHARAETLATTAISFIVFFAGAQLFLGSLRSLIAGTTGQMPGRLSLVVTAVSIVGKLVLAWTQFYYGRKAGSSMLIANGKNMRGDVVISASVLVGLGLGYVFNLPLLDPLLGLLVSLWIVKVALGMFRETSTELMEGSESAGHYSEVYTAVESVPGAGNPHRTRIRKLGPLLVVDLDVEVEPTMTVAKAHDIAVAIERSIKTRLPEVYDVIVHIDPTGIREEGERFGNAPGETSATVS
jgi:cation diffusion facilitator family transporter